MMKTKGYMKKLLLTCLFIGSANYAVAQPVSTIETMTPEKFAQHKALTLEALDKRDKIIEQEKACVIKAKEINTLKGCFIEAKQNRKEMGKELRARIGK